MDVDAIRNGICTWITLDPVVDPFGDPVFTPRGQVHWSDLPPVAVGQRRVIGDVLVEITAVVPIGFGAVSNVDYPHTGVIDCRGFGDPENATCEWYGPLYWHSADPDGWGYITTDLSYQVRWGCDWSPGRFACRIRVVSAMSTDANP